MKFGFAFKENCLPLNAIKMRKENYKYIKGMIRGTNKLIFFNMLAVNETNKPMIALTKTFLIM